MTIKINYIDLSNDANNEMVVFFQRDVSLDFDEMCVAWKVIQNCGQGCSHRFDFPGEVFVNATDSWGNQTPWLSALEGQAFEVKMAAGGTQLSHVGTASSSVIQVANHLTEGSIRANIYKDNRIFATLACVSPGQTANFRLTETLYVGTVAQAEEGQVIDSAIISELSTKIDLFGVASADIVMTGGGVGVNSKPYEFFLDNVILQTI